MRNCNCHRRFLSGILCIVLTAATALFTAACSGGAGSDTLPVEKTEGGSQAEDHVLGTGSTVFPLAVVDQEGTETEFEIHTDKETVGEALEELEFIAGEESEYGLYVKTVNGITVDYDKDGAYWAFYINGEYAQSGVDTTVITEGDSYSFKVEEA